MRTIVFLVTVLGMFSSLQAVDYSNIRLLSTSSSAALSILGREIQFIAPPTDPTDLAFSLVQIADSLEKGPGTLGLEFSPFWLAVNRNSVNFADYAGSQSSFANCLLQNLTASIAISNEIDAMPSGTAYALGVATSLIRPATEDFERLESFRPLYDEISAQLGMELQNAALTDELFSSLQMLSDQTAKELALAEQADDLVRLDGLLADIQEQMRNRLVVLKDSLILSDSPALESMLSALRERVETEGLNRRGFYLDVSAGTCMYFEDNDWYSNRLHRYGVWFTGGWQAPTNTVNGIIRYTDYHWSDPRSDFDAGTSLSWDLGSKFRVSGEYVYRHSWRSPVDNTTTNRFDVTFTVNLAQNTSVSMVLGKDFEMGEEDNLLAEIQILTGVGSSRPIPVLH